MTSTDTAVAYYDREGQRITVDEWIQLRGDEAYRLLRLWHRCCQEISVEWVGVAPTHIPRHVFVLRIDGGRFDGATLHARSEAEACRVCDQTIEAVNHGKRPWWITPIRLEGN